MSFFTSFCDLPQKEQHRVWFSRFSKIFLRCAFARHTPRRPACRVRRGLYARNVTLLGRVRRLLDDGFIDESVFLGLPGSHEVVAIGVLLDAIELLAGVLLED